MKGLIGVVGENPLGKYVGEGVILATVCLKGETNTLHGRGVALPIGTVVGLTLVLTTVVVVVVVVAAVVVVLAGCVGSLRSRSRRTA